MRSERSASGRAGQHGSRRQSRLIARRWMERTRARVPLDWAYDSTGLGECAGGAREATEKTPLFCKTRSHPCAAPSTAISKPGEGYWLPIAQRRVAEMEAELAEMKVRAKGNG